jgi:hypothetical protein
MLTRNGVKLTSSVENRNAEKRPRKRNARNKKQIVSGNPTASTDMLKPGSQLRRQKSTVTNDFRSG